MWKKWDCFVHHGVRHVLKEKLENFQKLISMNPVVYCFQLSFSIMCGIIVNCLPAPCGSAATKAQLKKRRRMAILPDCHPGNKAILPDCQKAPPLPLMLASSLFSGGDLSRHPL